MMSSTSKSRISAQLCAIALLAAITAGCREQPLIQPGVRPSFYVVGDCFVLESNYAAGTIQPNDVIKITHGVISRGCCEKAGTVTITPAWGTGDPLPIVCNPKPVCPVESAAILANSHFEAMFVHPARNCTGHNQGGGG